MWSQFIMGIKAPAWLRERDNKLRTAVFIFAGILVADLLLYAGNVVPTVSKLDALESTYAEIRKRHADAIQYKNQKVALTGTMAGIPAQKDMPLLVKELVQMARRQNLVVSSVKYDIPKRASGELTLLSFSFPAEGKYGNIKRFIYDVETSARLVGIQELKMDADKVSVKLDMKLLTYVKGQ